jgi:hypothetical protein
MRFPESAGRTLDASKGGSRGRRAGFLHESDVARTHRALDAGGDRSPVPHRSARLRHDDEAYLAEAFPEAGLSPRPEERADYFRWLFFAAGPVEQAVTNTHAKFIPTVEQGRMFGYGSYDLAVGVLERAVSAHPYIAGARFTAADVYVGSTVGWGVQFGTLPKRDAFVAYWQRVTDREAHRRASAMDDALMPRK